jgi:hypothetical protein
MGAITRKATPVVIDASNDDGGGDLRCVTAEGCWCSLPLGSGLIVGVQLESGLYVLYR